jgi:hypothetical protein
MASGLLQSISNKEPSIAAKKLLSVQIINLSIFITDTILKLLVSQFIRNAKELALNRQL